MTSSYQPLYLKYRPQSLADLVGQNSVFTTLTNAIEHDRIAHAYLFTGPRGCGKTSSARILAKSLNCQKGPIAAPCQTCTSCLEVKQANSPSVIEIDAASNNSVDDARILIERAPLVSAGGRYKIYIIDECHMLTKEAFNALLKTIEEPPPRVIFVLATTEEHKVPPTIISRCQRLMFRLINHNELSNYLKKIAQSESINIEDQAVDLIARRSGGGLRDALGLLDQASLLSTPARPVALSDLLTLLGSVQEDVLAGISKAIIDRDGGTLLGFASRLLAEGREPSLIALELSRHFLSIAKSRYGGDCASLVLGSPKYIDDLKEQAPHFDPVELAQMVELLDKLEQSCKRSTQPALTLEIGLLSLCHRNEITQLRELSQRLSSLESQLTGEDSPRPARTQPPRAVPQPGAEPPVAARVSSGSDTTATERKTAVSVQPESAERQPVKAATLSKPAITADLEQTLETSASVTTADTPATEPAAVIPQIDEASDSELSVSIFEKQAPPQEQTDRESAAPRAVESEAGEASYIELDEKWSAILDDLNERHRPTYSLASTHVTPISMSESDLILGTKSEMFQKMIEGKSEHIKAAARAVLAKSINVKIKVMSQEQAGRPEKKSTKARQPAASQPERYNTSLAEPDSSNGTQDPDGEQVSEPVKTKKADVPEPKSGLVQEAYRLFEGPGSRQFGD